MTVKYTQNTEKDALFAVKQVKEIIEETIKIRLFALPDRIGFSGIREDRSPNPGILTINGKLETSEKLTVQVGLIKIPENLKENEISKILDLQQQTGILQKNNEIIETVVKISTKPLGPIRVDQLKNRIKLLDKLAQYLQIRVNPESVNKDELLEKYKNVKELISPIFPHSFGFEITDKIAALLAETREILVAGLSIALTCESSVTTDFFLGLLAGELIKTGDTIGRYANSVIAIRSIPEIVAKAPGSLVLPALTLSFSSNSYERADEIDALMAILGSTGKSIVFSGSFKQQQAVFGSGQAKKPDPLSPLIVNLDLNDITIDGLIKFSIGNCTQGLSVAEKQSLLENTLDLIKNQSNANFNPDLIPCVVRSLHDNKSKETYILKNLIQKSESFRGLPKKIKTQRNPDL